MATGYTSRIKDGATFRDFALICARGFGALVMMREESLDAPIPEEFAPSDYHQKELAKAEAELAKLNLLTVEAAAHLALEAYDNDVAITKGSLEVDDELMAQYEAMLRQVNQWQPPTSDHTGLKDFMIQQIESSIKFDGHREYHLAHPPELLSGEEWIEKKTAGLTRDTQYHTAQHQEELERTASRNKWVKDLRGSLPEI